MKTLAYFLVFFAPFFTYAANLVQNPGFEEVDSNAKPLAWKETKPVYQILDGAGRNGSRGLAFNNSDPAFYSVPSQRLNVEPGQHYSFSVWVKTSGLKGDENGATVCIQWSDKNGEFLGGSYPDGIKGDRDWQKIEGSVKIPVAAASVSISPYVRKGLIGRAWFDDLSVTHHIPPMVGVMCGSDYRGISTGGISRYFAEIHLAESGMTLDKVDGLFVVKDKTGVSVFSSPAGFMNDDHAEIEIDTSKFVPGNYTVEFTLRRKEGSELGLCSAPLKRVEKFPDYRVYIDSHRRTIVDGKPFFPLGMYWSGINKKQLDTFAQGPFNCLMPYGMLSGKQVDLVHEKGLKIIYSVKDIYNGTRWAPKHVKNAADELEFIKQKVSEFKDHPALLAWYINDELPLNMIDRLSARRDLMEELDPSHPTWVVLYQYNQVRSYLPSFDVVGTDPYPLPNSPVGLALKWTRETRDQCFGMRPMWQVPQVFDWAGYKKGEERKKYRAPTLAEMRSMAWNCIAAGANGLVFYSYFDLYKMNERDPFEERWNDVCAMGEEIKRFIPVMLSIESAPELSWIKSSQIEARVWSYKGQTYILVVNGGNQVEEARLLRSSVAENLVVEFGDAPERSKPDEYRFMVDPLKPIMIRFKK